MFWNAGAMDALVSLLIFGCVTLTAVAFGLGALVVWVF